MYFSHVLFRFPFILFLFSSSYHSFYRFNSEVVIFATSLLSFYFEEYRVRIHIFGKFTSSSHLGLLSCLLSECTWLLFCLPRLTCKYLRFKRLCCGAGLFENYDSIYNVWEVTAIQNYYWIPQKHKYYCWKSKSLIVVGQRVISQDCFVYSVFAHSPLK